MCKVSKSVLVVDDDTQILTGTTLRLTNAGYQVCTATDGDIAVQLAIAENPDIILMDVSMPRMSGIEALVRIRADSRTKMTPVVMLSASLSDQQKSLDFGARFFVRKPYIAMDLLSAMEKALF